MAKPRPRNNVSGPAWPMLLIPPVAPVLGSAVAGALVGATYFCKLTFINAQGETTPGPEASFAVPTNSVLTVAAPVNPVSSNPSIQFAPTGYNVYVSTGSGTETKQNGSPIAMGTPWQMSNTGLIVGAAAPVQNTTQISGFKHRTVG